MPARHFYDADPSSHPYHPDAYNSYNADGNPTADILRSVQDQEAQFQRFTEKLEAERQIVAPQTGESRVGSDTVSMNSISSTADTFQWGGPQTIADQDESLRYGDESHGLMDSCLRELEGRGFGEDNMNYTHEDPYNSSGRGPYGEQNSLGYQYSGGVNGGNVDHPRHNDISSVHSSHVSLQSAGSNRNAPRQLKVNNRDTGYGSRTSLPHDQPRNYEDLPPGISPRGPSTPTRFNNYYDDYEDNQHSSKPVYEPNSPARYGVDSFDNPSQPPFDSPDYYDPSRGGPDDRYGNPPQYGEDDRYREGGPVDDSFYRQSPMLDNRYGQQEPRYHDEDPRNQLPQDNYMTNPDDRYRDHPDNSFQGHPDDSFQGHPDDGYRGQPDDGYRGQPDDGYRGQPDDSYRGQPDDSYHGQPDDSYRGGQPVDRYGQPLEDSFQGRLPEEMMEQPDIRYRDSPEEEDPRRPLGDDNMYQPEGQRGQPPQDNRLNDYNDDGYRGHPNDRYDEQPINDSFQGNHYPDRYEGAPPPNQSPGGEPYDDYGEDPYRGRGEPDRRHEGLPMVQDDPFADDPFRQKQRSLLQLQEQEPYNRGPSPGAGSDRMERPPNYDHMDGRPPYEEDSRQGYPDEGSRPPYYDQDVIPTESRPLRAPPDDYPDDGRRTPSVDGRTMRWRPPDLQEVIDYLSHPSDSIKANSAAYLTHLSYRDDDMKQKIRGLDGIPPIVELLNSEFPEVHKNACSALKNISYGRANDDNKRAIKNAGGIPALVRLLRKTSDEEVKDSVTGVLWNLSSCEDLKKVIIDDSLAVLVNVVIIPYSGWDKQGVSPYQSHEPLTTVLRNATGVLRNVSSSGMDARKKLRECHGLVDSLIHAVRMSIDKNNMDNKPVENCVCTLRNLSFRIQEIEDPDFYRKRTATLQKQKQLKPKKTEGESPGCFGRNKGMKNKKAYPDMSQVPPPRLPPGANEYRALWGVDATCFYLRLLAGANPVTLEASCGAIQNLVACDWKPAIEVRALVRKEKGLPSLVDLLTYEVDRVVGAAATALRNLAIDERNKELIGKYAMKQLISNLPQEVRPKEVSDETMCAVLACLNEVLNHNQDFVRAFHMEEGVVRLIYISRHQDRFSPRVYKFNSAVLKTVWSFKVLHSEFQRLGYTEKDFNPPQMSTISGSGSSGNQPNSNFSTPYNTISRPMQSQGYDDTTMASRAGNKGGGYPNSPNSYSQSDGNPRIIQGHSNPALAPDQDHYKYGSRGRVDEIPMQDMGPGYAPIDEPQRNQRNRPPVGGVPLFPNLQPGPPPSQNQQQHSPQPSGPMSHEPLYAQVNKKRRPEDMGPPSPNAVHLEGGGGQDGADSWV